MNYIRPSWETEEHSMFRESTRRFIEKEFVPNRERWIEQGYMEPEYWQKAGETGLLCPDVPVDFGGGGGDFGFDAITYEEPSAVVLPVLETQYKVLWLIIF